MTHFLPKSEKEELYDLISHNGLRVRPDILVSLYGQVLVSNLCFRNPEKLLKSEEVFVRPTCISGFSRYWVMVSSLGVCSLAIRTLVPATET